MTGLFHPNFMSQTQALARILERGFRIGPLHFWWARRKERLRIALAYHPDSWHLMTPEQRATAYPETERVRD